MTWISYFLNNQNYDKVIGFKHRTMSSPVYFSRFNDTNVKCARVTILGMLESPTECPVCLPERFSLSGEQLAKTSFMVLCPAGSPQNSFQAFFSFLLADISGREAPSSEATLMDGDELHSSPLHSSSSSCTALCSQHAARRQ